VAILRIYTVKSSNSFVSSKSRIVDLGINFVNIFTEVIITITASSRVLLEELTVA